MNSEQTWISVHYVHTTKNTGWTSKKTKQDVKSERFITFNDVKSGKAFDYISRDNAVYIEDEINVNFDLDAAETDDNFVKYMNARTKNNFITSKSGAYKLFSRTNDEINSQDAQKMVNDIKDTDGGQFVWSMVINPGKIGVTNKFLKYEDWNNLLNTAFKSYLKTNGLNNENITGFWSIHANTNFPHIHCVFWEKEMTFKDSNGELSFKDKGYLDSKVTFEKQTYAIINSSLETKKLYEAKKDLFDYKKTIKSEIKKEVKSELDWLKFEDKSIFNCVVEVNNYLKTSKHSNFNWIKDEKIIEDVKILSEYLEQNNPQFKEFKKEWDNKIDNIQNNTFSNNYLTQNANETIEKEQKELNNFVNNAILKMCGEISTNELYIPYKYMRNFSKSAIESYEKSVFAKLKYKIANWNYQQYIKNLKEQKLWSEEYIKKLNG